MSTPEGLQKGRSLRRFAGSAVVLCSVAALSSACGTAAGGVADSAGGVADSAAVTVLPTVENARTDVDLIEARQRFGLPTDERSMQAAVEETSQRNDGVDPIGAPLTDRELAAVQNYDASAEQRHKLTEAMRKFSAVSALWVFNRDFMNPVATLQITKNFPPAELSALKELVPDGFRTEVAIVKFSSDEVVSTATQMDAEIRGTANEPGPVAAAVSLGLRPIQVLFTEEKQFLTLVVDSAGEKRSDEELTALLADKLAGRGLPTIQVSKGVPD